MAKIRKAVFRSGIVMLSLLAAIVLSSSVAYAQECIARAKRNNGSRHGNHRSGGGHRTAVQAKARRGLFWLWRSHSR